MIYLSVPDNGLEYGLGCSQSSSQAMILAVHKSKISLGMSMQRAASSSAWVTDCATALIYFFASNVPENMDQVVLLRGGRKWGNPTKVDEF